MEHTKGFRIFRNETQHEFKSRFWTTSASRTAVTFMNVVSSEYWSLMPWRHFFKQIFTSQKKLLHHRYESSQILMETCFSPPPPNNKKNTLFCNYIGTLIVFFIYKIVVGWCAGCHFFRIRFGWFMQHTAETHFQGHRLKLNRWNLIVMEHLLEGNHKYCKDNLWNHLDG